MILQLGQKRNHHKCNKIKEQQKNKTKTMKSVSSTTNVVKIYTLNSTKAVPMLPSFVAKRTVLCRKKN